MIVERSPDEMQATALEWRGQGLSVGLVPTMGFLHEGHLSLVRIARSRADRVVVSLFVNPTQFGPSEDYQRYPRDEVRDLELCREAGVDVVFVPAADSMYAPDRSVSVVENRLSKGLCGASRPGHFDGVLTVVAKLFLLCQPTVAVFGEKDAQQLRVIRRMARDFNFPVEIVGGPLIRESDGVAMSSRNQLLSVEERAQATGLHQALLSIQGAFAAGERRTQILREIALKVLENYALAKLDYLAFVDDQSLDPVQEISEPTLVALAVHFPSARLIDNLVLRR